MQDRSPPKSVLLFAYGNPSRGDDALGPALYEQVEKRQRTGGDFEHVELLTDFQLQIEHVLDLRSRRWVLFVDASQVASPPYTFDRVYPARETGYTTHSMSPAGVLAIYQKVYAEAPPPTFMLSIRGYRFGLGQPLSTGARRHLKEAFSFLCALPLAPPFDIEPATNAYRPELG